MVGKKTQLPLVAMHEDDVDLLHSLLQLGLSVASKLIWNTLAKRAS